LFTVTLPVMGLIFQLPIGILAVSRLGIVTPKQLARNRRYAYRGRCQQCHRVSLLP
jgi:sec-independent protein translocase protein TatC